MPNNRIKEVRTKMHISTNRLAEMTGISQSTISKIENGKRSNDLDIIKKIALALNVDIVDLMSYDENEYLENKWKDPNYLKSLDKDSKSELVKEKSEEEYYHTINSIPQKEKEEILLSLNNSESEPLTNDEKTAVKAFLEAYRKMKQDTKE